MTNNENNDKTRTHVMLTKGTSIGHYRIVDKIGAGGMGEVYLAEDTQLDRKVALKFLPPHLCQDEDCRKRFRREAQSAAKLSHPNIVTIHEVTELQDRPFFVMEHVEGRSLTEVVASEKVDADRIVGWAIQLCDGLAVAHEAGTTHRDIKPSNIVIDANGRPKLLDFGLAAIKGGETLTKTGSTLGTIGYMSPEQIEGKEADARSDLFSFGVVLYELITNQAPFRRDDEAATLKAILADTPEPLARYKSDVPDELQRIVSKLLEKDPALRYQSASGVIPDLKKMSRTPTGAIRPEKKVDWWNRYVVPSAVAVMLIVLGYWFFFERGKTPASTTDDRIMLAVLPFENLGDPEDEYFADGITDEIISRLATLHGLGVISRTSSLQYKGTTRNLRQIGAELGVEVILEGTIRWDKSGAEGRVRINPQLIRVDDDVHLWADRYEAVLGDVFTLQSDIAEKVVEELGLTLLQSERQALAEPPTDNIEAYDYYLRAIDCLYLPPRKENIVNAIMMFQEALALAPDFVAAHAWLSFAHGQMYLFQYDLTPERIKLSRASVDRALELSPDHTNAHSALGWYYYQCAGDMERAFDEFEMVRENSPSEATAYMGLAAILRRQGNWEASAQTWKQAVEFDPLAARVCFEYGYTLHGLRRYSEAVTLYDRAMRLNRQWGTLYTDKAWLFIEWKGDTEAARQVLSEALQANERWPELTITEIEIDILERSFDQALGRLSEPGEIVELYEDSVRYYNLKGNIYRHLQRPADMAACLDSSRVILERRIEAEPEDPNLHAHLGYAYAGLGMAADANRESELAVKLVPVGEDATWRATCRHNLAMVYTLTGEYERAVNQLDQLLSMPSDVSVPYLKISPDYDPLRDHPRFRALLEKYAGESGS